MSAAIFLDHVGIAVRDLDAASADYARLGFAPTPLSVHAAASFPGAAPEPTGSGNHCIMLRDGYVELIGATDPGKPSPTRLMLERYEGLHILALGATDAAAARDAVAARGLAIASPVVLERDAAWGRDGRETRRATFANAHLDREAFPEARAFVIEHKTPEVIWQSHQMVHPNRAIGLVEAWICSSDPSEAATRFARLAGADARQEGKGEWVVPLSRGRLRIVSAEGFAARAGGQPPAVPGMGGITVVVEDLAATGGVLKANGVAFGCNPAGLLVTGEATHGAAILFTQESREQD